MVFLCRLPCEEATVPTYPSPQCALGQEVVVGETVTLELAALVHLGKSTISHPLQKISVAYIRHRNLHHDISI